MSKFRIELDNRGDITPANYERAVSEKLYYCNTFEDLFPLRDPPYSYCIPIADAVKRGWLRIAEGER
jgi:hypothetical protein